MGLLVGQPGLFEQVDNHVSSGKLTSLVEMDTDEFTETGRVVVPHSLGITPGLKHRVGLDNLVLKGSFSFLPLTRRADGCKVGNDFLGVLSLSSTGLTSDKDGLVDARAAHALVSSFSNGKDMWPALITPLANIQLHGAEGGDRVTLVRIDGNTEETRIGVNKFILVPNNRVPQDASITKIGEVSHVLGTIVVTRVDLADLILLEDLHLSTNLDCDFDSILGFDKTLKVATIGLVWHPYAVLWIVGFG